MNPHFRDDDPVARWAAIADELEERPEGLRLALENLQRWECRGRVHPGPLREWRRRIEAAMASTEGWSELIDFLRTPNHDAEPLKSCSPFVGLLPRSKPLASA